MIRAFFAISIGLIAGTAAVATIRWASGRDIDAAVLAAGLAGAAVLAGALAVALREVLRGVWKIARDQRNQRSRLLALEAAVRLQSAEQAMRDDVILAELVKDNEQNRGLQKIQQTAATKTAATLSRIEKEQQTAATKSAATLSRIEKEQATGYQQIESLVSLVNSLGLRSPLPRMRHTWALSPDSAAFLVETIFQRTPRNVLELGSGVSTVLVARALDLIGSGHLRSLEQDSAFIEKTAQMLIAEGLSEVDLVHAGISEVTIGDSSWPWYSPAGLSGLEYVDVLIVDGPPGSTGVQARYPALPMVAPFLRDGSVVFLDDAGRDDEQSVIQRWLAEFPLTALDVPKLEKGVALLEWRS